MRGRTEGAFAARLLERDSPLRVRVIANDVARLIAQPEILGDHPRLSAVAIAGNLLMTEHGAQKWAEKTLLHEAAYNELEKARYGELIFELGNKAPPAREQHGVAALPLVVRGGAGGAARGPLPPPEAVPAGAGFELAPMGPLLMLGNAAATNATPATEPAAAAAAAAAAPVLTYSQRYCKKRSETETAEEKTLRLATKAAKEKERQNRKRTAAAAAAAAAVQLP